MYDLQLVYIYIESSHNGISDVELQFGTEKNLHFVETKLKERDFRKNYYLTSVERSGNPNYENSFFDTERRLKRIDLLVGKNGVGKTTILHTMAGYGYIGCWIEVYYSSSAKKYYFFASENEYIPIGGVNPEVSVYVNGENIEPIGKSNRQVFLSINSFKPNFILEDKDGVQDNMLMKSNFSALYEFLSGDGRDVFAQLDRPYLQISIGIYAEKANIPDVINSKKAIIHLIKMGNISTAMDYFKQLVQLSFETGKSIDISSIVSNKDRIEQKINMLHEEVNRLADIISSLNEKGAHIFTSMTPETSYSARIIREEDPTLYEVTLDFSIEIGNNRSNRNNRNNNCEHEILSLMKTVDTVNAINNSEIMRLISFSGNLSDMSTGELAFLDIYSKIYYSLTSFASSVTASAASVTTSETSVTSVTNENNESHANNGSNGGKEGNEGIVLLLMDEPETYMHPEWSRQMIGRIVKLITSLYNQHPEWKFSCQMILTTHTPYLLSDMLPCFVHKIERNGKEISVSGGENCFASNLYDILDSNFFVSNPIGDFALGKLNDILENTLNKIVKKEKAYEEDAAYLIDQVGDEYLKSKLKLMLGKRSW